jgi:hypothetical protein
MAIHLLPMDLSKEAVKYVCEHMTTHKETTPNCQCTWTRREYLRSSCVKIAPADFLTAKSLYARSESPRRARANSEDGFGGGNGAAVEY